MKLGNARLDFDALLIESPAGRFSMEPKIMQLLQVLVENHNIVMTREELIDAVWGVGYGGDERLSRAISILRKALGDTRGRHRHIETIPKRGYRLIAELGSLPESEADLPATNGAVIPEELKVKSETPSAVLPDFEPQPHTERAAQKILEPPGKKIVRPRLLAIAGIVLAAVLLIWISPIGRSITAIPQNNRVELGLQHVQNYTAKDAIPQAQIIFSSMLSDNPDHAAARAGLALALMREYTHLERDPALLQRAKSAAESALRADEHLALANIAVGWATEYEGDYANAHKAYDRAEILDPDNIFTIEGRSRIYRKQGKLDKGKAALEKGISIYPDNPLFRLMLAEIFMAQDEQNKAESLIRRAIQLDDDNPRAYAMLSHTLHHQDQTTEAIRVLQDGLEINETASLYNNLGVLLFFQGQYELAAGAFERTLDLTGNTHDYLYWANVADAYRWVPGKKKSADIAYDRALQLLQVELDKRPDDPTLLSRGALYLAKRGHLDRARDLAARISFEETHPAMLYYRITVIYEILAERDTALMRLKQAIDSGYPLTEIKNDPELKALRQDQSYHQLLALIQPDE